MLIEVHAGTLRRTKWYQFAVRLIFGGAITAIAGIIAKRYGPAVGGLFLAFPAIFPAAATLSQSLENEKKQEHGLTGQQRGILAAGVQAHGAALGSIGLAAFAAIFWWFAPHMSLALLLPLAVLVWAGISVGAWFFSKRVHLFHGRQAMFLAPRSSRRS